MLAGGITTTPRACRILSPLPRRAPVRWSGASRKPFGTVSKK